MGALMRFAYKFVHKHTVEIEPATGESIHSTCLLGFFSSEIKCKEAIPYYLKQPGFKDYPDDFVIEEVEADIDDFNDNGGEFESIVFYLSHEYYDGEYDYVTDLGYYSSRQLAEKALIKYQADSDLAKHPDGFCINECKIDKREWLEGFFTY